MSFAKDTYYYAFAHSLAKVTIPILFDYLQKKYKGLKYHKFAQERDQCKEKLRNEGWIVKGCLYLTFVTNVLNIRS